MAATKKAVTKKAATKKAVVKKAATAVAPADLNVVEGPLAFTNKEAQNLVMIGKNQDRILKAAVGLLDIAVDTGNRLLALKDAVKKHGGKWKEWAQTENNLPFSYEQSTRYQKLAANPTEFALVKADGVTSIEEAVRQIEYIKKPEKQAAAEAKAAEKAAAPAATAKAVPFTINAAFDMLNTMTLEDLRAIQGFVAERIEELVQAEVDDDDDANANAEIDAAADVAEAAEDVSDHVDPLS